MLVFFTCLLTCCTVNFLYLKQLFEKYEWKNSKIKTVSLLASLTGLTAYINLYHVPILNLIMTLFGFMLFKILLFNNKLKVGLRSDIMDYFVLVFLDSLSFFIAGIIYPSDIGYFREFTSCVMVLFLSTILFGKFRSSKFEKVPKQEILLFFSITVFSVLLIYIFSLEYSIIQSSHKIVIFFIIIGLVILNIIIFHYLEYINKNYELRERISQEKIKSQMMNQHYLDMNELYKGTSRLIHDFKNQMYTMSIAYENGKKETAEAIMRQFADECANIKMKFSTGSDILDIILNDKLTKASLLGIRFEFTKGNIKLNWIKEFDMITIFGNVLDYTLEINENFNKEQKYIKMSIIEKHNMVIIKTSSSINNTFINTKDLFYDNRNINHKYCLQNIKKSIDTYNGEYDITIKNDLCEILILLQK